MKFLLALVSVVAIAAAAPQTSPLDGGATECHVCERLFEIVKKVVPYADDIGKIALEAAIKDACAAELAEIPFGPWVCTKVLDFGVNELAKWIKAEDKRIIPSRVCAHMHIC